MRSQITQQPVAGHRDTAARRARFQIVCVQSARPRHESTAAFAVACARQMFTRRTALTTQV